MDVTNASVNSDNFSDMQRLYNDETMASMLPLVVYIGLIAAIGIPGNIVVIYIYSMKYPKCNFKYFVLLLAGIDLLSCTVLMPLEIATFLLWFAFPVSWLCKTKSFINAFSVSSSALSLLLIAIDRFKKVCRPHSKQIQPELAVKLAFVVLGIALIPSTSDAVFWGLHTFHITFNEHVITAVICEKDDKYKDTIWPTLHTAVLYSGINVIAMVVTLILYTFIAVKLFCLPTGPLTGSPKITVSAADGDKEGQSETCFQFPSDIETGVSESEDLDKSEQKTQRWSSASIINDIVNLYKNRHSDSVDEAIPMEEPEDTDKKSKNRLSLDILNPKKTKKVPDALELPNDGFRRKSARGQKSPKSPISPSKSREKFRHKRRRSTVASIGGYAGTRLRRKTLIMFILTAVFCVTTLLYLTLISVMSHSDDIMHRLGRTERTIWLFFLRFYFINSVLNPVLYGFLDPRFKRAVWNMGVHISWYAGSLKKNIGNTIRRSASGRGMEEVQMRKPRVTTQEFMRSSNTFSD